MKKLIKIQYLETIINNIKLTQLLGSRRSKS